MKNTVNETMGYNPSIPKWFVDKVYKELVKTTFVVEKGLGEDYYKAAVFNDGTVHLNVDRLSKLSAESAKSSIGHELVHINQEQKRSSGERGTGEYGYNTAVNNNKINPDKDNEEERLKYLYMIENLQEDEIEARLSQIYYFVKESTEGEELMKDTNKLVNIIVENIEDISHLQELKECIDSTKNLLEGNYAFYINLFVKDVQNALYGSVKKKGKTLEENRRVAMSYLSFYEKWFERYRHRVYNTVYHALEKTQK